MRNTFTVYGRLGMEFVTFDCDKFREKIALATTSFDEAKKEQKRERERRGQGMG